MPADQPLPATSGGLTSNSCSGLLVYGTLPDDVELSGEELLEQRYLG